MRYSLIILVVILLINTHLSAQTNDQPTTYVDVLHMKDSTIIYGTIVYMIPKKQINIKVKDRKSGEENIETISMNQIERIAKEDINTIRNLRRKNNPSVPTLPSGSPTGQRQFRQEFTQPMMQSEKNEKMLITQPLSVAVEKPNIVEGYSYIEGSKAVGGEVDINEMYRKMNQRQGRYWDRDIQGMRVFTDYAYGHGFGKSKSNYLGWGNSIGYQNDPYFYFGVGMQYNIAVNKTESTLPLFINPRVNFLDNKVTPYFDLKGGYSVASAKGIYFCPSAGVSIALKGTSSLDFGIGYSYQQAKWTTHDKVTLEKIKKKDKYHSVMFKVTYSITFWKF